MASYNQGWAAIKTTVIAIAQIAALIFFFKIAIAQIAELFLFSRLLLPRLPGLIYFQDCYCSGNLEQYCSDCSTFLGKISSAVSFVEHVFRRTLFVFFVERVFRRTTFFEKHILRKNKNARKNDKKRFAMKNTDILRTNG